MDLQFHDNHCSLSLAEYEKDTVIRVGKALNAQCSPEIVLRH
jgi:hypothetical protein